MTLSPIEPPLPQIEGYKILGEIGRGGYGVVYKAEQTVLGRTVAIKNISLDLTREQGLLDRFMREARIVAQIGDHENIVQVHDVKQYGGVPCIIMEFVEGRSVADMLHRGEPPDLAESVRIIGYTLRALQYAHDHNITHRDVKPENIMVNRQGKVKVMDFGIAFSGEMPRLTQRGFAVGTPQYMSPEQLRGRPVDGRSDIYSTAVLFFYLATGRLPFEDTDQRELGLKHIRVEPPSPRELAPEVPVELERAILKGLAKKPEERFQNARDFEAEIQEFLMKSSAPSFTLVFKAYQRTKDRESSGELDSKMVKSTLDEDLDLPGSTIDLPSDEIAAAPPKAASGGPIAPKAPLPAAAAAPPSAPAPFAARAGQPPPPEGAAGAVSPPRGRTLLVLVAVLVLGGAALGYTYYQNRNLPDFERNMREGNALMAKGKWIEAEILYQKAEEIAPPDRLGETKDKLTVIAELRGEFKGSLNIGRKALDAGDAAAAINAFNSALNLYPDHPEALELLKRAEAMRDGAAPKP